MMYAVILNGDRAEADDLASALVAAATLIQDRVAHGGSSCILRREVIVTRDGVYDGVATTMARDGRRVAGMNKPKREGAATSRLLRAVERAAKRKRQADEEYRAAIRQAYEALIATGHAAPYSAIARAAGVERQAVRQLLLRQKGKKQ